MIECSSNILSLLILQKLVMNSLYRYIDSEPYLENHANDNLFYLCSWSAKGCMFRINSGLRSILPVLSYLFTYFCDFCTQMLHFDGFQCLSLLPENERLIMVRNSICSPQHEWDKQYNSLQLTRKYARISVFGPYLFREVEIVFQ